MEHALAVEDPRFVSVLQGKGLRRTRPRLVIAGIAFGIGVLMLLGGAVFQTIWVGVAGFAVMLVSATVGLASWRGGYAPSTGKDAPFSVIQGGKSSGPKMSFVQRMEQRWNRRRDRGF